MVRARSRVGALRTPARATLVRDPLPRAESRSIPAVTACRSTEPQFAMATAWPTTCPAQGSDLVAVAVQPPGLRPGLDRGPHRQRHGDPAVDLDAAVGADHPHRV